MSPGFESRFQRHLEVEQRRAVLHTISEELDETTTLGEILDAAEALGWSDTIGNFRLAELASALLPELASKRQPDDVELAPSSSQEDVEDEPAPTKRVRATAAKPAKAKPAKAKPAKAKPAKEKPAKEKPAKEKPAKEKASRKATAKAVSKSASKSKKAPAAKPKKPRKPRRNWARLEDAPLTEEQAADAFVPLVAYFGEASMQQLEDETGISRRKLRYHVGQLVKAGWLARSGMGRGTVYSVVEE